MHQTVCRAPITTLTSPWGKHLPLTHDSSGIQDRLCYNGERMKVDRPLFGRKQADSIRLKLGSLRLGSTANVASTATSPYWPRAAEAGKGLPAGPLYATPWAMVSAFSADPLGYFQAAHQTFGDIVALHAWPFASFSI